MRPKRTAARPASHSIEIRHGNKDDGTSPAEVAIFTVFVYI